MVPTEVIKPEEGAAASVAASTSSMNVESSSVPHFNTETNVLCGVCGEVKDVVIGGKCYHCSGAALSSEEKVRLVTDLASDAASASADAADEVSQPQYRDMMKLSYDPDWHKSSVSEQTSMVHTLLSSTTECGKHWVGKSSGVIKQATSFVSSYSH